MASAPQPACFLIADISGYTGYLAGVELDHAQDILADLLNTVVSSLRPGFRLAKLEGDAVFTWRPGETLDGTALLDTIERCYLGFRRRRRDIRQATACECDACRRIPELDLKFVVHFGTALQQSVAGRKELLGADVVVIHRLLKNDVAEALGMPAYALFTQACLAAAGLDGAALGMRPITETYDRIGDVPSWAHDLGRRWQEEEARTRTFVRPEDAIGGVSIPVRVPPQVAWEYLTRPGQRMAWQPWVTGVEVQGAAGGRRGPGSRNHCAHGRDGGVVEEILDWRPYDYVTDLTIVETPAGAVRFPHTIELEPTVEGTTIHMRFGWPKSARERALAPSIAGPYGEALANAVPTLVDDMEFTWAVAAAVDGAEP